MAARRRCCEATTYRLRALAIRCEDKQVVVLRTRPSARTKRDLCPRDLEIRALPPYLLGGAQHLDGWRTPAVVAEGHETAVGAGRQTAIGPQPDLSHEFRALTLCAESDRLELAQDLVRGDVVRL